MNTKHTAGEVSMSSSFMLISEDGKVVISTLPFPGMTDLSVPVLVAEANAKRLMALWNACQNIPTKALEEGVVEGILEALKIALFAKQTEEERDVSVKEACKLICKIEDGRRSE